MTKTQVAGFLAGVFSGLEASRFLPHRFRAVVAELKSKVIGAEAEIAAGLPETFAPKDVVDRLFTLAEAWLPAYKAELEIVRWVVDALLTAAPVAA